MIFVYFLFYFFFFNDTATTEIYTLSLHDALPILRPYFFRRYASVLLSQSSRGGQNTSTSRIGSTRRDRKSTRLNSSHSQISYAVFCLKKKKNICHLLFLCRLCH